jgi:cobalt transporter subunit CbtB
MQNITTQIQSDRSLSSIRISTFVQIGAALALGLVLLYGVGFASMDIAHSAAHDARHAFAFPCH